MDDLGKMLQRFETVLATSPPALRVEMAHQVERLEAIIAIAGTSDKAVGEAILGWLYEINTDGAEAWFIDWTRTIFSTYRMGDVKALRRAGSLAVANADWARKAA